MENLETVFWYNLIKTVNDNFAAMQAEITALKTRVTELES